MRRVYFIKPVGMDGPIKIGCSESPARRRIALEAWSPFPLELVATIEGDCLLEQRFHAEFIADHERLEWFRITPRLLAVIGAINAGTFDIETLPRASGTIAGLKARTETWEPIDYDYYDLFQDYRALPPGLGWWKYRTLMPAVFARRSSSTKTQVFNGLRAFMSQYPTQSGRAA